ncbi:transmembrane protein 170B [Pleuronectes platessa]|uniref:transmembrane protein 170B n=1 Tax=Pleuronectes platessa TaxID=8262 RepID=UPI00232A35C8|nr:transmembrane protein 170B [Pleuronectes platessa]
MDPSAAFPQRQRWSLNTVFDVNPSKRRDPSNQMNPDFYHSLPLEQIASFNNDSIERRASPGGGGGGTMSTSRDYSVNLSVQQVLSLWVQGATLQHLSQMWYWVFLWCLFSSLFVHGAVGLLMLVMLQRHKRGRLITLVLVSVGFLASLSGGVITSAAVAGVYRVAGKDMAPLEALVLGVGQTSLSVVISFSRILATL